MEKLDARDFLQKVLPPEGAGWYVAHVIHKEFGIRHRSFRTIDQIVRWLEVQAKPGWDIYFAVAAFKLEFVYDEPDETGYRKPHRRSRKNIPILMVFHGDVDTQETHPKAFYKTKEEARAAVRAYCAARGLPEPCFNDSGGGVHFYFVLTAPLAMEEWTILATGLKHDMLDFGVHIDKSRAADPCSVLRVPGFTHSKTRTVVTTDGQITPIDPTVFEQFRQKGIDNAGSKRNIIIGAATPGSPDPRAALPSGRVISAVLGGFEHAPSSMRLIRSRCRQVEDCAATPARYGEPFHRAVAGLARQAGTFDEYLEWIDPEWCDAARAKSAGWNASAPTCAYFRSVGDSSLCNGCPLADVEGASPIFLGRPDWHEKEERRESSDDNLGADAAEEEGERSDGPHLTNGHSFLKPILDPPWEYYDGGIAFVSGKKDGSAPVYTPVFDTPIYVVQVLKNEASGDSSIELLHKLPHEPAETVMLNGTSLGDGTLSKELHRQHVTTRDPAYARTYIQNQCKKFNMEHPRSIRFEQCGFKNIGEADPLFVHGDLVHASDSCVKAAVSEELERRVRLGLGVAHGGSVRDMVELQNKLFRPDDYLSWYILLASYGAIFHSFLDHLSGGLINSLVGPSGGGKTGLMHAALALWGTWQSLTIKHYDTPASMGLAFAAAGHLPMGIDEVHHIAHDPQFGTVKLRALIDLFTGGTDKHRAQQGGKGIQAQMLRWSTNCFFTSNVPLVDHVEANAKTMDGIAVTKRMVEFMLPKRDFDHAFGDGLKAAIDANAGHCGNAFLNLVFEPGVIKALPATINGYNNTIWKRSGWPADERYRVHGLTVATTAFPMLQSIGLVPPQLDIIALIQWFRDHVDGRKEEETADEPSLDWALRYLHKYLSRYSQDTLRVLDAYKVGISQNPRMPLPRTVTIRHELHAGRIYTQLRDFKEFMVGMGVPYKTLVKYLQDAGVMLPGPRRFITLGAGTDYAVGQVPCVGFDTYHPAFNGIVRAVEAQYDAANSNTA